jgi:hypothetical protein
LQADFSDISDSSPVSGIIWSFALLHPAAGKSSVTRQEIAVVTSQDIIHKRSRHSGSAASTAILPAVPHQLQNFNSLQHSKLKLPRAMLSASRNSNLHSLLSSSPSFAVASGSVASMSVVASSGECYAGTSNASSSSSSYSHEPAHLGLPEDVTQPNTAPHNNTDQLRQWLCSMELRSALNGITDYFSGLSDAAILEESADGISRAANNSSTLAHNINSLQPAEKYPTLAKPGEFVCSVDLPLLQCTTEQELAPGGWQLEGPAADRPCKAALLQQLPPPAFVLLGIFK